MSKNLAGGCSNAPLPDEAPFIYTWRGREAVALQSALRMTNDGFAAHLGVAVRTVAAWHADPSITPRPDIQEALDVSYERIADEPRRVRRFVHALGQPQGADSAVVMAAQITTMQARIDELQAQLAKELQS